MSHQVQSNYLADIANIATSVLMERGNLLQQAIDSGADTTLSVRWLRTSKVFDDIKKEVANIIKKSTKYVHNRSNHLTAIMAKASRSGNCREYAMLTLMEAKKILIKNGIKDKRVVKLDSLLTPEQERRNFVANTFKDNTEMLVADMRTVKTSDLIYCHEKFQEIVALLELAQRAKRLQQVRYYNPIMNNNPMVFQLTAWEDNTSMLNYATYTSKMKTINAKEEELKSGIKTKETLLAAEKKAVKEIGRRIARLAGGVKPRLYLNKNQTQKTYLTDYAKFLKGIGDEPLVKPDLSDSSLKAIREEITLAEAKLTTAIPTLEGEISDIQEIIDGMQVKLQHNRDQAALFANEADLMRQYDEEAKRIKQVVKQRANDMVKDGDKYPKVENLKQAYTLLAKTTAKENMVKASKLDKTLDHALCALVPETYISEIKDQGKGAFLSLKDLVDKIDDGTNPMNEILILDPYKDFAQGTLTQYIRHMATSKWKTTGYTPANLRINYETDKNLFGIEDEHDYVNDIFPDEEYEIDVFDETEEGLIFDHVYKVYQKYIHSKESEKLRVELLGKLEELRELNKNIADFQVRVSKVSNWDQKIYGKRLKELKETLNDYEKKQITLRMWFRKGNSFGISGNYADV